MWRVVDGADRSSYILPHHVDRDEAVDKVNRWRRVVRSRAATQLVGLLSGIAVARLKLISKRCRRFRSELTPDVGGVRRRADSW